MKKIMLKNKFAPKFGVYLYNSQLSSSSLIARSISIILTFDIVIIDVSRYRTTEDKELFCLYINFFISSLSQEQTVSMKYTASADWKISMSTSLREMLRAVLADFLLFKFGEGLSNAAACIIL